MAERVDLEALERDLAAIDRLDENAGGLGIFYHAQRVFEAIPSLISELRATRASTPDGGGTK